MLHWKKFHAVIVIMFLLTSLTLLRTSTPRIIHQRRAGGFNL